MHSISFWWGRTPDQSVHALLMECSRQSDSLLQSPASSLVCMPSGDHASPSATTPFPATALEALYSLSRSGHSYGLVVAAPPFAMQFDIALKGLKHQPAASLTAIACLANLCRAEMLAVPLRAAAGQQHCSAAKQAGTFNQIDDCINDALLVSTCSHCIEVL